MVCLDSAPVFSLAHTASSTRSESGGGGPRTRVSEGSGDVAGDIGGMSRHAQMHDPQFNGRFDPAVLEPRDQRGQSLCLLADGENSGVVEEER